MSQSAYRHSAPDTPTSALCFDANIFEVSLYYQILMQVQASILEKIKLTLTSVAPEAEVILYGSQARGDARPESDVDLLILLPDSYEGKDFVKRKLEISGKLYDLSLALGIDISPLILVPKIFYSRKTPFTANVVNDGIRL